MSFFFCLLLLRGVAEVLMRDFQCNMRYNSSRTRPLPRGSAMEIFHKYYSVQIRVFYTLFACMVSLGNYDNFVAFLKRMR